MPITDPSAFIKALLSDPEFRRECEEEGQRDWENFTLRLLAWDGESEELPRIDALDQRPTPDTQLPRPQRPQNRFSGSD